MSAPIEIARVPDLKHLYQCKYSWTDEWMLYGIQTGTQTVIELSDEPCWKMKLNDEDFGRMKGLGDWNQDRIIDWVGLVTCAECTSNHLLYINGVSSVVPRVWITVTSKHGGYVYVSKYWTLGSKRIGRISRSYRRYGEIRICLLCWV